MTYSVKEVADMLKTNPETVRRWIRDKKLDASLESKRGGHIICEAALQEFLKSSPKYAGIAKTSLAGAAVLSSVVVGGLIAQLMIDAEQIKKVRISADDMITFLRIEIKKHEEAIEGKKVTVKQLQKEIHAEQLQIKEINNLIVSLADESGGDSAK